jgi:short-subunit dehydrogenase
MNKTVLITGASNCIGYELSKVFASKGCDLFLVARREEKLTQIAEELNKTHHAYVKILVKDLSNPKTPEKIFDIIQSERRTLDILVNNSGFGITGSFVDSDLDLTLKMMQLHMNSLVSLTRLFLPGMLEYGHGKILNVASTCSFAPVPTMAIYAASKAFILSFSRALSQELKETNIQITALCPDISHTGFYKHAGTIRPGEQKISGMNAEKVAQIGYRALLSGQTVVIPGFYNQLLVFLSRFFPSPVIRRLSQSMKQ